MKLSTKATCARPGGPAKVALTDWWLVIVTVQLESRPAPESLSQPVQPMTAPRAGVAVNVTTVPLVNGPEQFEPHSIPAGLDVTVPLPRVRSTVNLKRGVIV